MIAITLMAVTVVPVIAAIQTVIRTIAEVEAEAEVGIVVTLRVLNIKILNHSLLKTGAAETLLLPLY